MIRYFYSYRPVKLPDGTPKLFRRRTALSMAALVSMVAFHDHVLAAEVRPEKTTGDKAEQVIVIGSKLGDASVTRLPLTVREIPQSITEIPRELIDAASMTDINDVMMHVPGVNVTLYDSQRPLYFSRGFQITDFQVDGIPTYSNSTNQEYDIALYEKVEVIRGANGLFSGPGVPSASINLIRKRPGNEFAASVSATVGSWKMRRGVADISVPLSESGAIRSRFVVAYQDSDSFRDRYREDKTAWMGIVEGDITEKTTLAIGYQNQDNNPEGTIWGTIPIFAGDGEPARLSVSTSYTPEWTKWQRESGTLFADVKHRFNEQWNMKISANRTKGEVSSLRVYATGFPDRDTGAGVYLRAGVTEAEDTRDSLDLYLTGSYTVFNREHELIFGASVSEVEALSHGISSENWRYDVLNAWNYDGVAPKPVYSKNGTLRITTTQQQGVYAANRLRITEDFSVIGGARISSWETFTDHYRADGSFDKTSGQSKYNDEITPYAGIIYDATRSLSIYASYTDTFNPHTNKDRNMEILDPALGRNLELGIKAELFDQRLSGSAAIFKTRQDRFPVQDPDLAETPLEDGSYAFISVDGTESKGIEFSLSGYLNPKWMIHTGYAYVDTKRNEQDLIWTNLPEHSAQLSTHYDFSSLLNGLTIGGGFNWQSKTIGYGVSHPIYEEGVTYVQAPYTLVNIHASWQANDHFNATFSATNIFDKVYWANIDYANYGEPRNISFSIKWQY